MTEELKTPPKISTCFLCKYDFLYEPGKFTHKGHDFILCEHCGGMANAIGGENVLSIIDFSIIALHLGDK